MSQNKQWELDVLQDLNESNLNAEDHAINVLEKLDSILEASNIYDVKNLVNEIMAQIQHTDLNRQKIQRAMNTLMDNSSINEDDIKNLNIITAPSAKHVDENDGDSISEEELAALIANSNN